MSEEIVKICKVHGELTKENTYKNYERSKKIFFRCKKCHYLRCRSYVLKNKEKTNLSNRKWKKNNREKLKLQLHEWRKKNPEKYKKQWQRNSNKKVLELRNKYVLQTIIQHTSLNKSDIPKSLIELKKAHLLLKRELKKIKENK